MDAPIGLIQTIPSCHLGVTPDGRPALTRFHILDRSPGFTLVRARIETGRTHQIRIPAAAIGHSLVGETWYRDNPCRRHPRQALHAWELRFHDELEPTRITCPLAADLGELIHALGLRLPA